jgi:hypothetical protein
MTDVSNLYSTHTTSDSTVNSKRQKLRNAGYYCFEAIEVRVVLGKTVIIDGAHRAKACWLESIDAELEYVDENELLNDDDIEAMTLYCIDEM